MTLPTADLFSRTVRSLLWQVLGVGGQRVIQLIAPMVISRLILPEEIGLFVTVLAGIGAVESLTVFLGEQTTISSQRATDRNYLDTVFTVRVLRGLLISGLLCGLAWPLAWFFDKPELAGRYWLPGLFLAIAGNGLIDAFQSPARAALMKGLDFRRIVFGDFMAALLGLGATLAFALLWHDVWALLVGHMIGTALRTIISYFAAPHRPRCHLEREVLRELFHYGVGAAGTPFLLLMIFTAPVFVLGKVANTAAVAVYDFAGRLAKLPEDIFLRVLAPVAVPAYAQLRGDMPRLRRAWIRAVSAFLLVGTPITVALAWCGNDLPTIAFGPQYGEVGGLFVLLAIHGGLAGMTSVVGPLFWAVGQPQWDRRAQFFRALVIYTLGVPAAIWGGASGFAAVTCLGIGVALAFSLHHALLLLDLRLVELARGVRNGLLHGGGLLAFLWLLDLTFAPAGWWRLIAAALTAGPMLAVVLLRLFRNRSTEAVLPEAAPDSAALPTALVGPTRESVL